MRKRAYLTDYDNALSISGYFSPETTYTVTIESGLADRWGKIGQT